MFKVLQLSSSLSRKGGGVFEIVKSLSAEVSGIDGIQIEAAGLGDAFSAQDWNVAKIPTTLFSRFGPEAFGFSPSLLKWLIKSDFRVIHLHGLWMYTSVATESWSSKLDRPFVVTPHGMLEPWALNHSKYKKWIARFVYENRMLRRASCIHALTEKEARDMRELGFTNPIAVIPNGIVPPPDFPAPKTTERLTALFLGRIHKKKGLEQLIRGWAAAADTIKQWQLVIAGWDDGGYEAHIRKVLKSLNLEDHIQMVGPAFGEKKEQLFRSASAFILPSFSEGLPMAILEAWSYRLPVLMTEQCNLPSGFRCNAAIRIESTAESIASGLTRLASCSQQERIAMGNQGRELVEREFEWRSVASRIAQVYQWVAGDGPKPACVSDVN